MPVPIICLDDEVCQFAEVPRVWLAFERDAIAAHELVAWLGSRYALRDVTFQEPEIEDVIRRIYENGLLL